MAATTSSEPPVHNAGIPCPNGALLHDIIIAGAGPCGLAAAARLREQSPAALFTDEEHRRFHWMKRHGRKMALKHDRNGRISNATNAADVPRPEYDVVVLDADYDNWMGRWNHLFNMFDIKHLRSPMFWHCDPNDRDSLLSRAYELGREQELMEIKGCVGKEVSKHAKKMRRRYTGGKSECRIPINERDRNDYFNPSQALFSDHCSHVVGRYGLQKGLVHKERVLDISFAPVPGVSAAGDDKLFTVRSDKGIRYAHVVILAVGPGNKPRIPTIPRTLRPSSSCAATPPAASETSCPPQVCHAMQIRDFPDQVVRQRIAAGQHTNVIVIGGGLTSAQLADLAIRRGVGTVWHMMRGPLRVKLFDVDLAWMGKFRNVEQSRFWQADTDAERLEFLKEARGGGSITPHFHRILKQHLASGKVRLFENTAVVDASFEDGNGAWRVKTSPEIIVDGVAGLPPMDYIYFATGVETDFKTLPYLQTMLNSQPIKGYGGFPCLNDDLAWKDGVPLFMAGRLAALKLGPAAPNLGGARLAAERIAWGVEEVMRSKASPLGRGGAHGGLRHENMVGYAKGEGNMFKTLSDQVS
ncbi:hypothetical protein C8A00DRAFT_46218 [Chaetomidium leptoderma]|uniref:L-ornithine N(5)-oxygenase n=1 Tax=Chaetomidium leptoderma TaxID=669021 RepID=A0AAN6VHQ3_9PEZI|nr:hypothetical protein C8A00DRAFT_46218 [Chaetomidium leptoderma]